MMVEKTLEYLGFLTTNLKKITITADAVAVKDFRISRPAAGTSPASQHPVHGNLVQRLRRLPFPVLN
jgi:hypothetical protein